MRFVTSLKIIALIVSIALLAIFYIQNTGPAEIQFPFGRPYRFGLIYMLLISFAAGVLTTVFITMMISAKIKRKRRSEESEALVDEG